MARGQHWNNVNELRSYPIEDRASRVDDAGVQLPDGFLSGLRLVYPADYGWYPFIAAASSTPGAVTVLLHACSTRDNSLEEFVPLASVTVPRSSLVEHRIYPLRAAASHVSGFVTFGSGAAGYFQTRFSAPQQSGLAARAYRALRQLPISSVRRFGSELGLVEVVQLLADPPLTLTLETLDLGGEQRDAIVLALEEDQESESVFLRFAGPCGRRPDSRTCGDPQPIERIGSVGPACDGSVIFELRGDLLARINEDDGMPVFESEADTTLTCRPPHLPNRQGLLPGEYDPEPEVVDPDEDDDADSDSPESELGDAVPYVDCFDDGLAQDFEIISGDFSFVADDCEDDEVCVPDLPGSPAPPPPASDQSYASEAATSSGRRNLSVWNGGDVSTYYRKAITTLKIRSIYPQRNGGIVINFRPHEVYVTRNVYYLADIDLDSQRLVIRRFDGTSMADRTSIDLSSSPLSTDTWYRLEVTVYPKTATQSALGVKIIDPATLSTIAEIPEFLVSAGEYEPDDGLFGLHANQSATRFSHFQLYSYAP